MQDQAGDPLLTQIKQGVLFPSLNFPSLFLTNFESKNKKTKHSLQVQRYANQSINPLLF